MAQPNASNHPPPGYSAIERRPGNGSGSRPEGYPERRGGFAGRGNAAGEFRRNAADNVVQGEKSIVKEKYSGIKTREHKTAQVPARWENFLGRLSNSISSQVPFVRASRQRAGPNPTSRMGSNEIQWLIDAQKSAFEEGDPLVNDFYFMRYGKAIESEASNNFSQPLMLKSKPADLLMEIDRTLDGHPQNSAHQPQNLHISTKNSIEDALETSTSKPDKVGALFTEAFNARQLGRLVKSDLKRPRELIAQCSEIGQQGRSSNLFSDKVWSVRGILAEVWEKISSIEDALRQTEEKILELRKCKSEGAKCDLLKREISAVRHYQIQTCNSLGEKLGFSGVIDAETQTCDRNKISELEKGWDYLFSLIWLPKGRALVARALPFLLESHQRAFLKIFCTYSAYFMCRNADGQEDDPVLDEEAQLDLAFVKAFTEVFNDVKDLSFVSECLSLIRQVFEENPNVLSVFLQIRSGQQLFRTILSHGKQLLRDAHESDISVWKKESTVMYEIMKQAVSNLDGQAQ